MKKIIPFAGLAICGIFGAYVVYLGIRAICYGILAICSMVYGFNMPELATIFNIF